MDEGSNSRGVKSSRGGSAQEYATAPAPFAKADVTTFTDKVNLPEAFEFIKQQLKQYDLTKVVSFELLPLFGQNEMTGGGTWVRPPNKYHERNGKDITPRTHYQFHASVNPFSCWWPCTKSEATGSEKIVLPPPKPKMDWRYTYTKVTYADPSEAAVFMAGYFAFFILRKTKQVPGRSGAPGATKFGLGWLAEWREHGQGTKVEVAEAPVAE